MIGLTIPTLSDKGCPCNTYFKISPTKTNRSPPHLLLSSWLLKSPVHQSILKLLLIDNLICITEEQGHASVYPSNGEPYHPPAPPSYDAVTYSSAPPQVHTASPQYVNTGPTIITTGPQVYRAGPTIITTQPVFTPTVVAVLGSSPSLTVCRVCNCQVLTRVDSEPSCMTHLCAGILCLTG